MVRLVLEHLHELQQQVAQIRVAERLQALDGVRADDRVGVARVEELERVKRRQVRAPVHNERVRLGHLARVEPRHALVGEKRRAPRRKRK